MKRTKILYLGLFLVAFFAVVVVLGSINAPPGQKTAEETKCVASSLANTPLVNGLGKDIKIPLFPDAKRFSFADTGASQYLAKAQDVEILSFYADRMRSLCWQVKEQNQNQVVYSQGDKTVRVSLLTNPSGRTIIDYVVLSPEGVLGTVKIAQQTCTSPMVWCPDSSGGGTCMAAPCPAPPPTTPPPGGSGSGSCTSGQVWCPSTSGTGGWCQMAPCPSSTYTPLTTGGPTCSGTYQAPGATSPSCNYSLCPNGCNWGSDGCPSSCMSSTMPPLSLCTGGQVWCPGTNSGPGWCQMPPCPTSSGTTCSGSYQQSGMTAPSCNWSMCPNGCTWGSNGCPSGCMTTPTSSSCGSGQVWCPGANGASGWCQMPPCPSASGSCGSGTYWCASTSNCVPNGGYCSGSSTCPAGQYMCNNTCSSSGSYCPPASGTPTSDSCSNGQVKCPNSYGGGWCQMPPCPPSTTTSCSSGQYMCNGACIANGSTCSPTTWPTDQASCASLAAFWCYPSGGGAGWCQKSSCPTNTAPTTTCPAGQQMCNGACIPSSTTCPTSTTWPTDMSSCSARGYFWCQGTSGGTGWCSSSSCPNLNATCPAGQWNCDGTCISTGMSCNGQPYTGAKSNQPPATQQPMNCMASQQYCPSSNTCIPIGGACAGGTTGQGYGQPGQYPPGQEGQFGPGQGMGPGMGPSEEEQQRMNEQQFKMMKKGTDQFAKGVTQMTKFVNQMKAKLSKSGVGIPAELTNALAKAPELVAKLKASKDMDEFQELMADMQDIGMTMQEWGPKLGELQRLVDMMKNLDKDVKNMRTNLTRVQKAAKKRPELAAPLKDVEAMFNDMAKRVADVKALAKTDPEGALDLVQEFYDNSEEFWNQVSFMDMVSNMTKGLTQANTQIRQIETRIRAMERAKGADKEFIATLKEMVVAVKAALPELRAAMAARPIDYEEVKMLAEDFWMQLQDLQNMMADQGQSFYMPTVKQGQGINVVIPEGFISSPGGSGGRQGAPTGPGPGF